MNPDDPTTPPDVLAASKRLKPDAQGRLVFRPRGAAGPGFLVQTAEQLRQAERFHGTKLALGVVTVGAAIGAMLTMNSSDDEGRAIGSVAAVLLLAAVLVYHSVAGWRRVVARTAMRPLA